MLDQEGFKNLFTPTNLKNGLSYWKKDQFELLEDEAGKLSATVYGTDEYRTQLAYNALGDIDALCTCPNYRTLFCKHVAVLYYELFKNELNLKKSKPQKTREKKKVIAKRKTGHSLLLHDLGEGELRALVEKALQHKGDFSDFVTLYFSLRGGIDEVYKSYKAKIQKLLSGSKRYGYIDYAKANSIGRQLIDFAMEAEGFYEEGRHEATLGICKAIIDKMVKPLEYTDTSSGIFYSGLDSALDILKSMAQDYTVSDTIKDAIFKYSFKRQKDNDVGGWDYEIRLLRIAITAAQKTKERILLEKYLQEEKEDDYHKEEIQLVQYELILKFDGRDAARKHANDHIVLPEFRRIIYEELLEDKHYEKAKTLMFEGIKVNKEFRGYVFEWTNNLLQIAKVQEDTEAIKQLAEALFLQAGFNVGDYYHVLKEVYGESWNSKRIDIEKKISRRPQWLRELFFIEKDAGALIKSLLEEERGFYLGGNLIDERFIEIVLPKYEKDFSTILMRRIHEYLRVNKSGKKYNRLCEQLIMLKKKGYDVKPFIVEMKESYSRRPSLMKAFLDYFQL